MVEVKIPPGIEDGQKMRLGGLGQPGVGGGEPGDLLLEVHVQPHPKFKRKGRDIHSKIRVDMVDAALTQAVFFEDESCGQCSPCRIGTQIVRQALERYRSGDAQALTYIHEVAWTMREASICGLGQAAPSTLLDSLRYFEEDYRKKEKMKPEQWRENNNR